jgi:hypothetical protein
MARARAGSAEHDARELAAGGPGVALAPELATWLAGSPRFAAFMAAHRSKVRKKLRGAVDEAAVRDVRTELAAARALLADRRFELAFEAYGRSGGPDFTVAYRGGRPFNIEVTRMRRQPDAVAIAGVVLGKLRQLPPSVANLLLVAVDNGAASDADVGTAVRTLRAHADAKDEAYFAFRGIAGTRAFYDRFLRLAGVVIWSESAAGVQRAAAWTNGSARIAVPDATMRALLASLQA